MTKLGYTTLGKQQKKVLFLFDSPLRPLVPPLMDNPLRLTPSP